MSSVINSSSNANLYASLFSGSAAPNWLAEAITTIQNEQNQGGLLGMLQNAGGDGSIGSFLGQSSNISNSLATISQTSVTNAGSLFAQIAATKQQQAQAKKLQDSLEQLSAQQQMVQKKNTLDPFIYLSDGTTIDTNNNIMTRPDGTQYDTTTGAKYVDPASIIQVGNGAYLNTKTNILTMPDGTQIDTVTGLTVTT
jgi:antitoxin (DNA-binding transcriptional repressor) of toxin-antitoxin stability system